MREKQEIRRIEIGIIQLVVVVFAAMVASKIPYTEITQGSIVLLGVVHVVSYYISSYYENLKYRGYLDELIATVKYCFIFALIVTFLSFFADGSFSISRRGLLYVTLISGVLLYVTNTVLKYFRSSIYTRRKSNKNILLISDQARLENVLSRMKDNMDGRITAVCVLDNPYFTDPFIKSVKPENLIEYATHSVVDQVLINLPSGQYKIWDYASPFEIMGIPVSINLNALEFMNQGEKRIQQLGPFKVVTFSTYFYSYGDILAKRFLDICGALVGLLLCGIVGIFLYPLIRKDGGPAIFAQDLSLIHI